MCGPKSILAVEPYYGGSHQAWLDGWTRHSRHTFTCLTLSPRKWKWRMRGSAMLLAERFQAKYAATRWNGLLATDMLNLAEFLALIRPHGDLIPVVLYIHENQISYPLHQDERIDYHYAFINLVSMLAATRVVFNSQYNRRDFFVGIRRLLKQMPDCHPPPKTLDRLEANAIVIPPCIDLTGINCDPIRDGGPPVILWNHRWDRDKQPERFSGAVMNLLDRDIKFRLILCGERFRDIPPAFQRLQEHMRERIVHMGYAESKERYWELLRRSDIVVSTSIQEFFGIGIVEAMAAGAFPCVPQRLNYPDLIPQDLHDIALYEDSELETRLIDLIGNARTNALPSLQSYAAQFDWPRWIERYDSLFE